MAYLLVRYSQYWKRATETQLFSHLGPFVDINPIQYNPYTEQMWKSALVFFDESLKPLEEHVGRKMKERLSSCSGNVFQVTPRRFATAIFFHSKLTNFSLISAARMLHSLSKFNPKERNTKFA